MNCITYAQTDVRVMRIHYNDGATSDIPVELVDSITFDYSVGNSLEPTISDSITSNEVLQRAYLLASIKWTPLKPVPKRGGGIYPPDVMVTGVPYSSVKELNTYLFQDVSYHTFMTAVHNPMSVLYTEDISQPPYHGVNCATYYGAVCSSSVLWALGIDIPYYANQLIHLPDFTMNEYQVIDSLKICDVIWKNGHVQMIYDIEYRGDTVYRITTFETSASSAHIKDYTKSQFLNIWNTGNYVGYHYNKLITSTEPAIYQEWEPIVYNDYLCPSKGDKSVYRSSDTIAINIFDSTYNQIILVQGATMIISDDYAGDIHYYYGLQPGVYSVFLERDGERTARATFEIVKTDVSYEWNDNEETITIFFDSSAFPEYIAICDIHGNSRCYPISKLDRWKGYSTVPSWDLEHCFCKVVFKGKYGRITNVPIRVE